MDKQLNILFLGGAKRVSIARMFQEAGKRRGLDVNIFSYELSKHVPIASVGKVIVGRRWRDEDILEHLHETVKEHDIGVIIPFVDEAVGIAARYHETFNDAFVPVSRHHLCDAMFDKILAAAIFDRALIPAPETYRKGKPVFPLIAKPRTGSASKGIKILENSNDFRLAISPPDRYLIQEYIADREEFTVDCYVSSKGEICCISPRKRIEVVGGEVSHTITVDDPNIVETTHRALERIGLKGAITVQYLRDKASDRLLIMEINPRLGGGAVCTVHAGGDIPGMIIDEALGHDPEKAFEIKGGTEIVRYFDEVVFNN